MEMLEQDTHKKYHSVSMHCCACKQEMIKTARLTAQYAQKDKRKQEVSHDKER